MTRAVKNEADASWRSVVASPGKDLLITAAHCINGGDGSGYKKDIVFIPGYRDGATPYGIWTPQRLLVAPQWANSADPDFDVGFVVLQPLDGENIQQVLGANQLGYDSGYQYLVFLTADLFDAERDMKHRLLAGGLHGLQAASRGEALSA